MAGVTADARDLRIAKMEGLLKAALTRIEGPEVEVRQLLARLEQNSNNSSKARSSDGPGEPKKPPTARRPRAQPRRRKNECELLPVEKVEHFVSLVPDHCGNCDGVRMRQSKEEQHRHQQVELPRPKTEVTEYQCHAVVCLDCGAVTEAQLPPEAVPVFGARLAALTEYRL
jgi:hypothetical protein